jgi:phosphoribosylpyrophosphate synthetase
VEGESCPEHIFRAALQTYIRGVIQPRYPSTELVEFFGTVFNAKRRGAPMITAVWPFSDGRSDRFARGENNETEDLADTASHKGIEHLVTVRMHSKDKQGEIWKRHGINVHDIDTTDDLAKKTVERYAELIRAKQLVVTTIDIGGKPGIREYIVKLRDIAYKLGLIANPVDIPWTVMDKERAAAHVVDKVTIKEGYGKKEPKKLEGKTLLAYDDMVDTSGSLMTYVGDVAEAYHVKELIVVVEHPVFSYPASRNLTKLHSKGLLREVVTYDTIPQPKYPWHVVLDSKHLVAAEIKKLFVPSNNLEMPPNPDW